MIKVPVVTPEIICSQWKYLFLAAALGVDGCHVRLGKKPARSDPALPPGVVPNTFWNRKNYPSINVQVGWISFSHAILDHIRSCVSGIYFPPLPCPSHTHTTYQYSCLLLGQSPFPSVRTSYVKGPFHYHQSRLCQVACFWASTEAFPNWLAMCAMFYSNVVGYGMSFIHDLECSWHASYTGWPSRSRT